MTSALHDDVFDAALAYIRDNAVEVKVMTESDSVALVDSSAPALDSNNFTGPADNTDSHGGRKIECLTDDSGDLEQVDVDNAGDAYTVVILDVGANVLVRSEIEGAPVTLGGADKVNFGTFDVVLRDPV